MTTSPPAPGTGTSNDSSNDSGTSHDSGNGTTATTVIGTAVRRVEDPPLLTGRTTFVANRPLDDALVVHFVTSIEAHAVVLGIDVEEARAMPGVVDVVTAADLDADGGAPPLPARFPGLPDGTGRPVLADDRVRYVGEPVAAVVAETVAQAADAAELVVIDYDPLPAVVDLATAADHESLVFPDVGTNVLVEASGGVEEAPDLAACEVTVELTTVNNRVAACPLETRAGAAYWTDDGRLVQYASCQGVHPVRAALARHHGLENDQVRVITADVGGSFGAKGGPYPEDLVLGHLARRAGRPVRWTPPRGADMVGLGHSRAQIQTIAIGGSRDGRIEGIVANVTGDAGAYPVTGPALMRNAGMVLPGPFDVPAVRWTGRVVATNTTPIAAYRGAGRPEGGAMLNRAIDAFAREIGMDTLDVMRANVIAATDLPWTNPTGLAYDSGDYREALELAAAAVDNDAVRARQVRERADGSPTRTGIGWAGFIDRTAGLPGDDWGRVELQSDGSLELLTSSSPYGQGHYTAWAMLAAERTGIPVDRIRVFHGDTDVVPKGPVTGGSRSAQRAGVAVAKATDDLVEAARARAADLLEAAPGDVVLDVGRGAFHVAGAPAAAAVDWVAVAASVGDGSGLGGSDDADELLACESDGIGDGPSVPFGFYAAIVTVDTETGAVTLDRMVGFDDAGTVLNPLLVEGQLQGAMAQGVGQALYEEFVYDANGNPLTASFLDYAFPGAPELPNFEVNVLSYPSPNNPLGVKGIAESGCIGTVPAIQNAVVDALADLGVRHVDLPLTPEKVWAAITEARRSHGGPSEP
ncbi:MAG: xanthine dehydrogenase family protein molybdopterin-binding subunit [Actinomycetota bacterium]